MSDTAMSITPGATPGAVPGVAVGVTPAAAPGATLTRHALLSILDPTTSLAVADRLQADGFTVTTAAANTPAPSPLHLLVCEAATPAASIAAWTDAAGWLDSVATGIRAPFQLVRDSIDALRAGAAEVAPGAAGEDSAGPGPGTGTGTGTGTAPVGARVIFLGEGWSAAGPSGSAAGAAVHGALIALMKTLARDLGPEGISVNEIAVPGGVAGHPDAVARAISYLAGPLAGSVIGQVLTVGALDEIRP